MKSRATQTDIDQSSGFSSLLSTDGTQLQIEKKQILKRWAEYFYQAVNHPAQINDKAIARLPQIRTLMWCLEIKSERPSNSCHVAKTTSLASDNQRVLLNRLIQHFEQVSY